MILKKMLDFDDFGACCRIAHDFEEDDDFGACCWILMILKMLDFACCCLILMILKKMLDFDDFEEDS